jgi:hypothetical protein
MIRDSRLTLRIGVGIATLLVLGTASVAHAQYQSPPPGYYAPPPGYGYPPPPPPPPPRYYRSGLTIGVGLGFGGTSANNCGDSCGAGFAYELHIGGMLNPQLALLFQISGVMHSIPNSSIDTYNTMYLAAVQFFPTNQLWLKGGVGLAHYTETDVFTGDQGDDTGKAIMVAAGYEVYQTGPFAVDLQLHLGESFYSVAKDHGTLAFLVGFNWY